LLKIPFGGSRHRVSAWLAFVLLAFQAVLPWTAADFHTQDGPAHLYMARLMRELAFSPHKSPYAAVYAFQHRVVTNWTVGVLLNLGWPIFGGRHVEQFLASFCVIAAFFSFAYLARAIRPETQPWHPLLNFLVNTWYVWIGFYNFYLGMILCALTTGYFVRHAREMTWKRAGVLAAGLVVLFFTHVQPLGLAVMAIGLAALWLCPRRIWMAALACLPSLALLAVFVKQSQQGLQYDPEPRWAWENFPFHVFASSVGRTGEEALLMPAMLCLIAVAALAMRKREWLSAQGALAASAAVAFLFYLYLPDAGFGGAGAKMRFAWAVFLFGGLAAITVRRMQPVRTATAIYITVFMVPNLLTAMHRNVGRVSKAVEVYSAALQSIPPGATVARMRYNAQDARRRFGFDAVALEPFFHMDALVAARRGLLDLTSYQPLNQIFPVAFRPEITQEMVGKLYDLESGEANGSKSLWWAIEHLPVPVNYVVVVGDLGSPETRASDFQQALQELDARMRLVGSDPGRQFVRVYLNPEKSPFGAGKIPSGPK
jgi:hypothetical protein